MFHSRDSPGLLVCDAGVYLEQNDIGFITVAICGGLNPYIAYIPQTIIRNVIWLCNKPFSLRNVNYIWLDFTCLALWDHIKWNIPTGLSRYYDYDVHKWNKNDDRHDIAIVSREIAEAERGGIQVCYWRAISKCVLLWVLLTHWCREQDVILRL